MWLGVLQFQYHLTVAIVCECVTRNIPGGVEAMEAGHGRYQLSAKDVNHFAALTTTKTTRTRIIRQTSSTSSTSTSSGSSGSSRNSE